jgi:hypothetical protein
MEGCISGRERESKGDSVDVERYGEKEAECLSRSILAVLSLSLSLSF